MQQVFSSIALFQVDFLFDESRISRYMASKEALGMILRGKPDKESRNGVRIIRTVASCNNYPHMLYCEKEFGVQRPQDGNLREFSATSFIHVNFFYDNSRDIRYKASKEVLELVMEGKLKTPSEYVSSIESVTFSSDMFFPRKIYLTRDIQS